MTPWLATLHENGLGAADWVSQEGQGFTPSRRHFHGSRPCPSADGHAETMKTVSF
jgi:hypothetical protein